MNKTAKNITIILFSFTTIFLGIVFFVWTVVPNLQMAVALKGISAALNDGNEESIMKSDFSFYPFTYVQPELRKKMLDYTFESILRGRTVSENFAFFAKDKLEEAVKYEKNYSSYYLVLGKAYDLLADLNASKRTEMLKEAELNYQKALSITRGHQRVMVGYSINLLNQGKIDEALLLMKKGYEEDPKVPEMNYYMGIMAFQKGSDKNYKDALDSIEFAFNKKFTPGNLLSKTIYEKLLVYFYNKGDFIRVKTISARLMYLDVKQSNTYKKIFDYIEKNNTMPLLQLHN